jgi:monoamine oxidase
MKGQNSNTWSEADPEPTRKIGRRDLLKAGAVALVEAAEIGATRFERPQNRRPKKVIVAGAGISGLSCAYELAKRGHDVTVLEASPRTGGHVRTLREPLSDGLYADLGAEQFTKPGYEIYWRYVEEFNLPYLYYPRRQGTLRHIGGRFRTEEELHDRKVLEELGFNRREVDYLVRNAWWNLPMLYFQPYVDSFPGEYSPYGAGLNYLDATKLGDLLRKDGASEAAVRFIGDTEGSALHVLWHAAILKLRGVPLYPIDVYRIRGGNQVMTDMLAEKLGNRVHVSCPVSRIERGESGVRVNYRQNGEPKRLEADYLVCTMSAVMLRQLSVEPPWPESKRYAIDNVPYYSASHVVFQTRNPFWEDDGRSINWETSDPSLELLWRMAEEVPTNKAILIGWSEASASAADSLAAFRRLYPGRTRGVERVIMHTWALDPWAMACETVTYPPGELTKIWPSVMEPVGRVYFAGAYADNLNWGQEAGTRSAHRAAEAIDKA